MWTPRLVIFDFDGTLFDTQESISHCISLTFSTLSQSAPATKEIRATIATGAGLEETFRTLGAGQTLPDGPAGAEPSPEASSAMDRSLCFGAGLLDKRPE